MPACKPAQAKMVTSMEKKSRKSIVAGCLAAIKHVSWQGCPGKDFDIHGNRRTETSSQATCLAAIRQVN